MKKTLLLLGLVLIAIGAAIMYGYSFSSTSRELERPPINYEENKWSVLGELKKGDWLVVVYRQSAYWIDYTLPWEESTDEVPVPHFYVSVSIADPYQNETTFVEALGLQQSVSPPRLVVFPPEITKNGSLQTILGVGEGGVEGVGGIVKYDGLYNVTMTAEFRSNYPPSYLGIFRYKLIEHRDIALLPIGAIVAGMGMTSSYFGLRNRKPKVAARRNRIHSS